MSLRAPDDDAPLSSLAPPLVVAAYVACVAGAGALANCALLAALFKKSKTGLFSILMQLAVTDTILLVGPGLIDVWSQNTQAWPLGATGCAIYRGVDVLTTTATIYLIITLVLHTIATLNLEEKDAERRARRNCENDEMRSSRHSLVANSDSSTPPRTMTIAYRIANTRVPVLIPSLCIWTLATSMSVPEFSLATTVAMHNRSEVCTFIEPEQRINMHTLLAVFDLFLPIMIMSALFVLTALKLMTSRPNETNELEENDFKTTLKLCIWLIVTYVVLSLPKSIVTSYLEYSTSTEKTPRYHMIDPDSLLAKLNLATSCVHLLASLFRPLLCIFLLPRLRRIFMSSAPPVEKI